MSRLQILSSLVLAAAFAASACTASAQQTFYERFRGHNAAMTALQFVVVLLFYPETKGQTLEELQRRLVKG